MQRRRLALTDEQHRFAAVSREVFREGRDELLGSSRGGGAGDRRGQLAQVYVVNGDERVDDGLEQLGLLTAREREPMVGVRAGVRVRAFRRVQARHVVRVFRRVHRARLAELSGQPKVVGAGGQKVGVDRPDDLRLLEVVVNAGAGAERELRSGERVVGSERVPPVGLRLGELHLRDFVQTLERGP